MRKGIGIICLLLGAACLLGAIGFAMYNQWEDKNAEESARALLADVQSILRTPQPEPTAPDDTATAPEVTVDLPDESESAPAEMATVKVNGYDCIGILSIPVVDMELPVLTDWSYVKLKKAPCHYYGTYYDKDFVIAAHNYKSQFARLSQLQAGDLVVFTDVNGIDHCYEVVLLETLPPEATLEMITSGFDLSLYTCTPGGASRVTVRCKAIGE